MKRVALYTAVALCAGLAPAAAQNLVITNAHILDGKGGDIARGTVVVRDGMVASVGTAAAPNIPGARVIDARGMTVMPGFIDAHRHIGTGDTWAGAEAAVRLQEFLDAGFTSVLSAGDGAPALELRQRTNAGSLKGPRLFVGARVPLARAAAPGAAPARAGGAGPGAQAPAGGGGGRRGDPARFDNSRPPLRPTAAAGAVPREDTVNAVDTIAKAGYDFIKTTITATPGGPETDTLKVVVEEGHKRNLPVITHAVTVIDTLAAVEARPDVLVHTPHIGRLEEDPAALEKIVRSGIPMTTTLAIFLPHFDQNNEPLFRDRLPFPWETISSAGQGPVNARLLWNAGISYGYGTDTSWHPRETLRDELRALNLTFSPRDIVRIMGLNAARSALKDKELGSLEPGKLADIVIVNGNPNEDSSALLNVMTTIKGGVVMVEKR
ncbi:MAG: amidohydrolase family protein [Vicinamibacterales bacterium]